MVVITTERALYEMIHNYNETDLKGGWETTEKVIDYLISILKSNGIDSSESLTTLISFNSNYILLKKE